MYFSFSTLEQQMRRHLKATNKSWRVDETYVRVEGRGAICIQPSIPPAPPIDSPLSALRDSGAAKQLFRKALSQRSHPQSRAINTDLADLRLRHPRPTGGKRSFRAGAGTDPFSIGTTLSSKTTARSNFGQTPSGGYRGTASTSSSNSLSEMVRPSLLPTPAPMERRSESCNTAHLF
jgi:hypothetical protein